MKKNKLEFICDAFLRLKNNLNDVYGGLDHMYVREFIALGWVTVSLDVSCCQVDRGTYIPHSVFVLTDLGRSVATMLNTVVDI